MIYHQLQSQTSPLPFSMVYVKAIENDVRGVDDLADCVGSLTIDNSCPAMEIRFNMVQKMFPDLVIEDNADCTTR